MTKRRRCSAVLALGLLSASAQAQTAIQVSGVLDVYAGTAASSGAPARDTVINSGGLTTSFWAVQGHEDLGAGRRVVFALESFMRLDTGDYGRYGGDPMFSRNAYVGLADRWGEVRVGRLGSPVWIATIAFNAFAASTRFSPLQVQLWVPPFGMNASGDTGWSNAVGYTSPTREPLVVRAQVGLAETDANRHNSAFSATWTHGPLALMGAAHRIKTGPGIVPAAPAQSLALAGASYAAAWGKLYATFDRASTEGSGRITKTAHVSAAVKAGPGSVLAGWAHTRDTPGPAAARSRDTVTLGYDVALSKRTDLYGLAMRDKLSTAAGATACALGIRHRF